MQSSFDHLAIFGQFLGLPTYVSKNNNNNNSVSKKRRAFVWLMATIWWSVFMLRCIDWFQLVKILPQSHINLQWWLIEFFDRTVVLYQWVVTIYFFYDPGFGRMLDELKHELIAIRKSLENPVRIQKTSWKFCGEHGYPRLLIAIHVARVMCEAFLTM